MRCGHYVTCVEGKRVALVGGPYRDIIHATFHFERVREQCIQDYPFTHFAYFGITRIDAETLRPSRYGA